MDEIALGPVYSVQGFDKFRIRVGLEIGHGSDGAAFWTDSVDASFVRSGPEIVSPLKPFGNPFRMFDNLPVHIDDVEGSVRTEADGSRAAPIVGRCEEFRSAFARCPRSCKTAALRFDNQPGHEIVNRFGHETALPGRLAIDHDRA